MYVGGPGASNSPRPSSASSNASSMSGRKSAPSRGIRPGVGPRPNEAICISEEVKIGINLAVERFRMNEGQKGMQQKTRNPTFSNLTTNKFALKAVMLASVFIMYII